jgi:Ca-activated chloride channel family protein
MLPLSDFHFALPWAFLGFIPVGLLGAHRYWQKRKKAKPLLSYSSLSLFKDIPKTWVVKIAWLPTVLRFLALTLIVFALARPQLIGEPEAEDAQGIDIVMAIDTSCSMRAADFKPKDRMFVAKKSINEFILGRSNDRVGLVVFAGEAASWVPLSLDYSLITRMLDEVEVGMIEDGTAIGTAIATALNRLRSSEAKSRVVILLTDGDNNSGTISPSKAADFAKELGIKVYTILIGKGGPVPFPAGKDIWGQTVFQNRTMATNPQLLKEIAEKTGGQAYRAQDKDELDAKLQDVLDSLETSSLESTAKLRPYAEFFPHAIFLALFLLGLEILLANTRLRRFP